MTLLSDMLDLWNGRATFLPPFSGTVQRIDVGSLDRFREALQAPPTAEAWLSAVERQAFGIPVVLDPNLPAAVVELIDRDGNVIRRYNLDLTSGLTGE